tara:strand:- start:849 stop:1814 length:966 start_codon:yes stop_codon:yes gene_type:complete
MKNKPIIIVNGEPNSIFLEILFKSFKAKSFRSPIILISSLKLFNFYMKKLKFKKKINIIESKNINFYKFKKNSINFIDVRIKLNNNIRKISRKSNLFIKKSFEIGINILKILKSNKLINGPISKKYFLNKKYPGITEYLAEKNNSKKFAMLIYNKKLSVCPLTTHVPIKKVSKYITKKNISEKVKLINNFYIEHRKIKPRIGILGLNPHCESTEKFNEDEKILKPSIKSLKKFGYKISGPYSADTMFIKNNRVKFDVIIGMYHDQVLTPMKTLFEYDAINITLGLSYIRISPDHGPNEKMIGKNLSNPLSLIRALEFLDKN